MKRRVFSGIQPSGNIHIGNYLGAIRHWVAEQDAYDNFYCIVDLHGITTFQEPALLRNRVRELATLLIAAGIDPVRSTLFVQSHVAAHAQLGWVLNCYISMGSMQRMTQYKEKAQKREAVSVGVFDYPALMAADILLYKTDLVPVGADQKQHVELARDVAQHFNALYGDVFTIPEPAIPPVGARIMGFDDPAKKMSKSGEEREHAVGLLDSADEIRSKILHAKTDNERHIAFDAARPGVNNLLVIYELLSGASRADIEARFAGKGYSDLKNELADLMIESLRPLQQRFVELAADATVVDDILNKSANTARIIADHTLRTVYEHIGLR